MRAYARVRRLGGAWRRVFAGSETEPAPTRSDVGILARSTPVFFVTGLGKSGTRWLTKILDSHPEVLCKGEGRFFSAGWRRADLDPANDRAVASSLYYALTHSEYLRLWIERSVWSRDGDPDEHLNALMRLATEYFLTTELSKTGKRLVGDKSPLLTPETIEEISVVYPEARVVHIIRDGRDAAVSAAHHARNFGRAKDPRQDDNLFEPAQIRKLAADWNARVGRTARDGPRLFGDRYAEVRYEDLLADPEGEMARLLGFLGAAADERSVGRCVGAASFERLSKGRTRGEEEPSSFFRKGVAGDWRDAFTEEDRRVFKEEAGELLIELGYEKDDGW